MMVVKLNRGCREFDKRGRVGRVPDPTVRFVELTT